MPEIVLVKLASTSEVAVLTLERRLRSGLKIVRSSAVQGDGQKFWVYVDVLVEADGS